MLPSCSVCLTSSFIFLCFISVHYDTYSPTNATIFFFLKCRRYCLVQIPHTFSTKNSPISCASLAHFRAQFILTVTVRKCKQLLFVYLSFARHIYLFFCTFSCSARRNVFMRQAMIKPHCSGIENIYIDSSSSSQAIPLVLKQVAKVMLRS